jgi:predicted dehydrogenase
MGTDTGKRRWRIGVIGCGAWGPNHVRNFSAMPNVEVVGVADLRQDKLARVAALVPGVAAFQSAAEMMAIA